MSGRNGYAALVRQRASRKGKRRPLDDYETPGNVTRRLTRLVRLNSPILEPACGSGRMVRDLRSQTGLKVVGFDIQHGADFFARTEPWEGDIVTNPPIEMASLNASFATLCSSPVAGFVCSCNLASCGAVGAGPDFTLS